jgi:hypothetical protein
VPTDRTHCITDRNARSCLWADDATALTHPRTERQRSIEAERRLNDEYVAERNKPPPF